MYKTSRKNSVNMGMNALAEGYGLSADSVGGKSDVDVQNFIDAPYDYKKSFAQQVDDFKQGKIPVNDSLLVGRTPKIWQDVGFNAVPVTINQTHVDYAVNGTKDSDHFIGEAVLKQIPQAMEEPVAIIKSQTHPDRAEVILTLTHNGKQVVVPIEVDGFGTQNSISIDSNALVSILGKNSALKQLETALRNNNQGDITLLYWNKKEATALLQAPGHQLPNHLPQDGFIHSIHESGSTVKTRYENVTQSKNFTNWFGDWMKNPKRASKVVNADGTPKVVYHGTSAEFDVFQSDDGTYWFSESRDCAEAMAEEHGSNIVMPMYLNIRNPYRAKLPEGQFSDPVYEKSIIETARKGGHDGVVIECDTDNELVKDTFYVTFNKNQMKPGVLDLEIEAEHKQQVEAVAEKTGKKSDASYKGKLQNGLADAMYKTARKNSVNMGMNALAEGYGLIEENLDNKGDSVVQYNKDKRFLFIGENAKTANLESLAEAKRLEAEGESAEKIYEKTYWFKGKDGKWRMEIDDSTAIVEQLDPTKKNYKLHEILKHDALYAAYPELRDVPVYLSSDVKSGAETDGKTIKVSINLFNVKNNAEQRALLKEALIHEVQHIIQGAEGFSYGGTVDGVLWKLRAETADYLRSKNDEKYNKLLSSGHIDEMYKYLDETFLNLSTTKYDNIYDYASFLYRKIPGEKEAYATGERIDLRQSERERDMPQYMKGADFNASYSDENTTSVRARTMDAQAGDLAFPSTDEKKQPLDTVEQRQFFISTDGDDVDARGVLDGEPVTDDSFAEEMRQSEENLASLYASVEAEHREKVEAVAEKTGKKVEEVELRIAP